MVLLSHICILSLAASESLIGRDINEIYSIQLIFFLSVWAYMAVNIRTLTEKKTIELIVFLIRIQELQ